MAGRGSRFSAQGYKVAKPLIEIHGMPMIRVVINNIRPRCAHRFIFLCLNEHIEQYQLDARLTEWAPGAKIVPVAGVTEGAACTVLLAKSLIDTESPLMIANSDQWIDVDINDYLAAMRGNSGIDGLIMTMNASDPKWSFVRLDDRGRVLEVVEKVPVSNHATVGIYNFRRGRDFVAAAEKMIAKDLRVNGEFYVAPVYNEMISAGMQVTTYDVGAEFAGMYGLGIPSDLQRFLDGDISIRAASE